MSSRTPRHWNEELLSQARIRLEGSSDGSMEVGIDVNIHPSLALLT